MDLQDRDNAGPQEEMPGMSAHDPLTYDPTQGQGSPAWQMSVKASMERNANERRN